MPPNILYCFFFVFRQGAGFFPLYFFFFGGGGAWDGMSSSLCINTYERAVVGVIVKRGKLKLICYLF